MDSLQYFGFVGINPQVRKEVLALMNKCSSNGKSLNLRDFVDFCDKLETNKWSHYDQVHQEMEHGGNFLDKIWLNSSGKSDSLPWNTFLESFFKQLGVSTQNQFTIDCLQYFFQVKKNTDQITTRNCKFFKSLFKSLFPSSRSEEKGNKFLTSICELYKQEFFFGYQTRTEAEKILNNYKEEAFLVRISENQKRLVLSCMKMSETHKIIEHEHYGKDSILEEYIQELRKQGYFIAKSKNEYFK